MPSVNQADGIAFSVQLQARGNGVPADNMLSAVATYATVSGEPRAASLQASLSVVHVYITAGQFWNKPAVPIALPWLVGVVRTSPDLLALDNAAV